MVGDPRFHMLYNIALLRLGTAFLTMFSSFLYFCFGHIFGGYYFTDGIKINHSSLKWNSFCSAAH